MTSDTSNTAADATGMTALEKAREFAASGDWSKAGVWAAIAQAELMEKRASFSPGAITINAQPGHNGDSIARAVIDNIERHNESKSNNPVSPVLSKFLDEARAIANIHIETMNMRKAAGLAPLVEDVKRVREAIDNYRQVSLEYNEACKNAEIRNRAGEAAATRTNGGQAA